MDQYLDWLSEYYETKASSGGPFPVLHNGYTADVTTFYGEQYGKYDSIRDIDLPGARAAGYVKKGEFLWTTTESGNVPAVQFARLLRKSLRDVCVEKIKQELNLPTS